MPEARLAVAVAAGDYLAVAGGLADAVAHVVGDPDIAALIDGDAAGPVAAGITGELAAVGRDLGNGAAVTVPQPGVVVRIDREGDRKLEFGRRVSCRTRERLTCAGKQSEVLVQVVDHPCRCVGVDRYCNGVGNASVKITIGSGG